MSSKEGESNFSPKINRKQVRISEYWMKDGSTLCNLSMTKRNGEQVAIFQNYVGSFIFSLKEQIQGSLRQIGLIISNRSTL
jgi:hypothetical protein